MKTVKIIFNSLGSKKIIYLNSINRVLLEIVLIYQWIMETTILINFNKMKCNNKLDSL